MSAEIKTYLSSKKTSMFFNAACVCVHFFIMCKYFIVVKG